MPCEGIRVAGVVFALALAFAPTDSNAQTNLVDLGNQSGTGTPVGLNNSEQIAFTTGLYSNGTLTPLGALPGSSINAVATGINAAGQLIGNVSANGTASPGICANPSTIPVLFANGTLSPLLVALDCALITPRATVTGINASGQTVGYGAYGSDETTYAWVLTNGTGNILVPPGGQFGPPTPGGFSSRASGISDNGFITGIVYNEIPMVPEEDAFLYSNGAWTDLGQGAGSAVNSNGQVTGYLVIKGQNHAFLYGAGVTTDLNSWLNATGSQGNAINATGQLVGNSTAGGGSGFFYNGTVTDLNALVSVSDPLKARVTLIAAVALNDNRLILASGTDSQDMSVHSYLVQGPWLDFAPGILDFASEAIGIVSTDQSVTVKNSGTTNVPVESVVVSGDFVIHANDCGTSLQAGGTCTIGVAFASSGSGDRTGGLT